MTCLLYRRVCHHPRDEACQQLERSDPGAFVELIPRSAMRE
jgi:hypothetical protein